MASMQIRVATRWVRRWRDAHVTLEDYRADTCTVPPRAVLRGLIMEPELIGGVPCTWLNRVAGTEGVLIYLHGGGFGFGPAVQQWSWLAGAARACGMAAMLIDYRLSPEHVWPAQLDDVLAVTDALQRRGALETGRWSIAGDSAGGNLAVAATLRMRDTERELPARLALMSPWMDLAMDNPAIDAQLEAAEPMLRLDMSRIAGKVYAGDHDVRLGEISPVYADLEGLPPILIHVGTAEILLPDIQCFVALADAAGVEITCHEYRDLFHVFPLAGNALPEARRAVSEQRAFLRGA